MTRKDLSTLNYILGCITGLTCGCSGNLQTGMINICEMLEKLIDKLENEEMENMK